MANGHGGKRTPRKPSMVSGPGRLARRTDGGPQQTQARMTGMGYGENKDFMDIQSSAPMAATPSVPTTPVAPSAPQPQMQAPQAIPLFSPTQRPNEPVTAGAPVGEGPGPIQQNTRPSLTSSFEKMLQSNNSPDVSLLYNLASKLGW